MSTRNIVLGLKSKFAFRSALIITLSSFIIFIPIQVSNVFILILSSIIAIVISSNISSFSNLICACGTLISLFAANFFVLIFNSIFGQDLVWPTFIISFILVFILNCFCLTGGRWFNFLFSKTMTMFFVIVYYISGPLRMDSAVKLIYVMLFCNGVVLVSILIYPCLTTRLFRLKLIKTLTTSRELFKGVGYKINTKLTSQDGVPNLNIKSKEELARLNTKLQNQIIRLYQIQRENKNEKWNRKLVNTYTTILIDIEESVKLVTLMNLAIENKFSYNASVDLIKPILPILETLIDQIYSQIGLIIDILTPHDGMDSMNRIKTQTEILESSFQETDVLIKNINDINSVLEREYEKSGLPNVDESEVTKIHYFINGIVEFANQQKSTLNIVLLINDRISKKDARVEILTYGIGFILLALPKFIIKTCKHYRDVFSQKSDVMKKQLGEYLYNLFIANERWRFPLQISFAYISSVVPFYYFENWSNHQLVIHSVWSVSTVVLVISPTVGASFIRGIHRILGSIIGAALGFVIAMICTILPSPYQEIFMMVSLFVCTYFTCLLQQDPRYFYMAMVSNISLVIILIGEHLVSGFNIMYSVNRTFHFVLGCIWVMVVSLTVFPFFANRVVLNKMQTTTKLMSNLFIDIVNLSFRVNTTESLTSTELKIKRQDFKKRLRSIKLLIDSISALMFDVKSELFLKRKKLLRIQSTYKYLNDTYSRLVALESSFKYGFSPSLIEMTTPLHESINNIFNELNNPTNGSSSNTDIEASDNNLYNNLKIFSNNFQFIRSRELTIHPEIILLGSSIYSIQDFLNHYIQLYNELKLIK